MSFQVGAQPFVPTGAGDAPSHRANSQAGLAIQRQAGPSQDVFLPEGDDILGMSATAPNSSTNELASQAAEIFRSMQVRWSAPPPTGPGPSSAYTGPQGRMGSGTHDGGPHVPSAGRGRGRYSGEHGPQGGRGSRGGRGGRGLRGGPGANRPSVSAYAVSQGRMQLAGQFMAESLRQDMQHRNFLVSASLDENALNEARLPPIIQQFHSLCPLEDPGTAAEHPSVALGVSTSITKGVHAGDGSAYALRRFDGHQVVPTADLLEHAQETVHRWSSVANHPNLVGLREAFASDEIGGTPALFLVYDYHPGALTLEQAHVIPTHGSQGLVHNPVTEEQLWSYLCQLTAALRAVHSSGLAVSAAAMAPSKVLLVAPARLRLAALGIAEVLAGVVPSDVQRAQREDLAALGSLLLGLACAARNAPPSLDTLMGSFSRELCHIVAGLLAAGKANGLTNWRSLGAALGDRVFTELEAAYTSSDTLAFELQKECENGRLTRLLIKMNMVLERAELRGDVRWSDTGDRYLLKLFRDFVFHQTDEHGVPNMDWGPMIEALNKADAGVEERIMLLSRDEASLLVVSYADVRRCLQMAYAELKAAARSDSGNVAFQ